ncbi:MAG: DUF5131 family protein [Aminobacterium sp.]|uniref:DUF5131 family protein n=1 Tax=Aminobacterium sp. TaxID=1872491 RepID=UPI002B1F1CAA|nr:DUF5131 family protein [Aminobacterium sp.]MEA4876799.1 DUF5131 family protein [Aminobacterium sp.]
MALQSSIEWTNSTWNPLAGCSCVSEGCRNCYAMAMAARLESMSHEKYFGLTKKTREGRTIWTGKIHVDQDSIKKPLTWKKPQLIFVNSMSDLFHENAPEEAIVQIWDVMSKAYWHTFQTLTKRPQRMFYLIKKLNLPLLPNLWLGTSVENKNVISRIDILKKIPATIRFVSFEPLIGSVGNVNLEDIDWAIVGGESGPRSRPLEEKWVDEVYHSCQKYGTLFFFKQWGGTNKKKAGRLYKGKTWDAMPTPFVTQKNLVL